MRFIFDPEVFRDALDNFFDKDFFNFLGEEVDTPLKGLMKQTDVGYSIRVEVPGFEKENIKVTYNKQTLSVTAEQTEGEVTRKYSYKTYLPNVDVNAIDTNLKNGVLSLTLTKKAEELPKSIEIK